ncbi:unnamed protein product [Pleuronectes platessa]|uniref:Uncharacterized protein n=1 Tax=Pleuronectes platessa TaxID=8262 RepID=A0A9N7Y956_PLEPL|nr:unnamed protein product [Pleuronectes platessa]
MSSRAKNEPTKSGRNRLQLQPSEPMSPERPGANEEMLRSIKVMMDDQRTEIVAKFESIISELVKKEVATAIKPLQEKVSLQSGTISDLECSTNEHSDQLTGMQVNMAKLSATVESLGKKCEELEARPRWHNIRLSSPLLHNGERVQIFRDFTPTVARRRAAFVQVKRELHACANVKFGLRYPATLHTTMSGGQTHRFEDLDQALQFVNKRLKKNPAPESD